MRVVFGPGSLAHVPDEVDRLGLKQVLVLSTPGQRVLADRVAVSLGDRAAGVFDQARMHVPVPTVDAAVGHAARRARLPPARAWSAATRWASRFRWPLRTRTRSPRPHASASIGSAASRRSRREPGLAIHTSP
ncbi:iron-containing alcohol dehydrogenase [Nocardioides sp. AN3]